MLRTLLSAAQTACSLISTKLTNPRCALCILLRRICDRTREPRATHSIVCCADGLLVNKHKAHESALRALHPATQICDRTREPRATHSIVCCADGLLVNKHKAHESALRALHPATQDIRSLITQEKQMPALLALVFLLRSLHYIITRGYVLYKIVFYLKWLTV